MSIFTDRRIGHDEAREIAQRLINSHFGNGNEARMCIPADPDQDDDLLICAYIEQQRRRDAVIDAIMIGGIGLARAAIGIALWKKLRPKKAAA